MFNFKVVRGASGCRDIVIYSHLLGHFIALSRDPALLQRDSGHPPPQGEVSAALGLKVGRWLRGKRACASLR